MIAAFLAHRPDAGRALPPENTRKLRALATKRRQLIEMRKALSCQMKQTRDAAILDLDAAHMDLIEGQIKSLDTAMQALLDAEPELGEKARLLRSVPGFGHVAAITLLAEMPELGTLTDKTVAALTGLAPDEPGQRKIQRQTLHPRRAHSRAQCPLHDGPGRLKPQSRHEDFCRAPEGERKTPQTSYGSGRKKTRHPRKRDPKKRIRVGKQNRLDTVATASLCCHFKL